MSDFDNNPEQSTSDDTPVEGANGNGPSSDSVSNITSVSLSPDDSRLTRLAKLRTDQHRRFQFGQSIPVERYLDYFAEHIDDETAIDLIYSEVLLRAQLGGDPTIDEYVDRFPQYAEQLRQQFEVFSALQSVILDDSDSKRSHTQQHVTAAKPNSQDIPQIPGYEILTPLGRGGMGVVWKAKQLGLNRAVALKMLHMSTDTELLARFRAEAETIARLRHENIVQIYDVGEVDDKPYFSMEFVEGGSLSERCGEPFPIRSAAQLVATLARAMQAAHTNSIVHRDLKPANILLQEKKGGAGELVPKIADFGLAKQLDQAADLTASGALMGTPNYMAPEQAEGRTQDIGPGVDIHALGCILYQLLTGRKAFEGKSLGQTLAQIRTQDPKPPGEINSRVHRDLETICLKCLQKQPDRRYASAQALADDLQRFLDGEPIEARPVSRFERLALWCRRHPASTVAALAGLFLAFVVLPGLLWYQAELRASQERERLTGQAAKSAEKAKQSAEELAKTQEYYALVHRVKQQSTRKPPGWTWSGLKNIKKAAGFKTKARNFAELRVEAARCLADIDVRLKSVWAKDLPQVKIAFSPNGRYLAVADYRASGFVFPCSVRLLDGDTGKVVHKLSFQPSLVFKGSRPVPDGARSVVFSKDNKTLFVGTRSGRIYRWSVEKPDAKPVVWKAADGIPIDWLCPTPDGNSLITGSSQGVVITRWKMDGAKLNAVAEFKAPGELICLALSPLDDYVAYDSFKSEHLILDAVQLVPVVSEPNIASNIPRSRSPFAFDPSGRMLFSTANDDNHFVRVRSKWVTKNTKTDGRGLSTFRSKHVEFNRSGALVLSLGHADENRMIQIWETASGRLQHTAALPGRHFADAAFHPSNDAIVVANDGKLELYEIGGLQTQRRIANQPLPIGDFDFSSDGKYIICAAAIRLPSEFKYDLRDVSRWRVDALASDAYFAPLAIGFHNMGHEIVATHPLIKSAAIHTHWRTIDIWNFTRKGQFPQLHVPSPTAATFSPNGGRLWTLVDEETTLESYQWPELTKLTSWSDTIRLAEGSGELFSIAVGNKYVVIGSRDGVTHLIKADNAQLVKSFDGHRSPVLSVAVNRTEKLTVSGYENGRVRVHRIPSGEVVCEFDDHSDVVKSVDFRSDGKLLATGSRDGTVHLYRVEGSQFRKVITLNPGPVQKLAFDPNGKRLGVLVAGENAVRIWDLDRLRKHLAELHPKLSWE